MHTTTSYRLLHFAGPGMLVERSVLAYLHSAWWTSFPTIRESCECWACKEVSLLGACFAQLEAGHTVSLHLRSRRISSDGALYAITDAFSTLLALLRQRRDTEAASILTRRLSASGLHVSNASSTQSGSTGGVAVAQTGDAEPQSQSVHDGSRASSREGLSVQALHGGVTTNSSDEATELWAGQDEGRDQHRHGAVMRHLDSAIAVLQQSAFYPSVIPTPAICRSPSPGVDVEPTHMACS